MGKEVEKNNGIQNDQPFSSERHEAPLPGGNITLESLVTMTGEMEHLNELVLLHVERSGGFTCIESYFALVTLILDLLEKEIRFRYYDGISRDQMKLIIQDWIDKEIASMSTTGKQNPRV